MDKSDVYNTPILRQAPLTGVISPCEGRCHEVTEGLTDRPARLRSLSKVNKFT